jgi:purine-nucleoside phosphorylase
VTTPATTDGGPHVGGAPPVAPGASPAEGDLDRPDVDPLAMARAAAAQLRDRTGIERHDVALVLGSGWAAASDRIGETVAELPASEVLGFSPPALAGHTGTIRSVRLSDGRHALVVGARTHLYEGKGVRRVVHAVRTVAASGARVVVLTNGCGSLEPTWTPGTPVLIADHINLTGTSPLEGATFVDLTDLYSSRLREVAKAVDPALPEGVYVQFPGPHYETPAEVRMAGRMGGSLVGMSTALEAIAARHVGLEVLGLSLVTNLAAGISATPLSHAEVLATGAAAAERVGQLLAALVPRL